MSRFYDVFLIVRQIAVELEKCGQLSFPIAVNGGILPIAALHSTGRDDYRVNVSFKQWLGQQFSSVLFRYKDHADIVCDVELNICWQRFSVCKETAHLLIDTDDTHFTKDIGTHIQGLITSPIPMTADQALESETAGIVAALELLLPWKLRTQLTAMRENGATDYQIAVACRVPQKYVSLMLGPYGGFSEELNRGLDGEGH